MAVLSTISAASQAFRGTADDSSRRCRRIHGAAAGPTIAKAKVPLVMWPSSGDRALHRTSYFPMASGGSGMVTCGAAGAFRSTATGIALPPEIKVRTAILTFSLKLSVRDFGAAKSAASADGLVLRNLAWPEAGAARMIAMAAAGNQYFAMISFSNGLNIHD